MSIIVENVTYVYMLGGPFEKKALNNINLTINPGEIVGIIGHTGSGKSTLIQHFNGLLKPTSGKVYVNGVDTMGKGLKELRKQVGMVFQYPEHQLFEETVYKDIAFGLQKLGMSESETDEQINNAISAVGLKPEVLKKSPFELSGGQKRRVAIAGVVAMNPDILIMDEPTAGLDPRGRAEVLGLVSNLHKNLGLTIVLVSHSMEDIARIARRIIVMNKGRVEMDGFTKDVFGQGDRLQSVGLSVPQIACLMRKLKKEIPELDDRIYTVEDAKKELRKYLGGKKSC